jgi:D-cysteine desulfhydrase family pyridoxal phosphate-dependent enzyme
VAVTYWGVFDEECRRFMKISTLPRLGLFSRPTPMHELKWLRQEIGAKPRIFMKRDDLTGTGLGGNKNRKLDFVMAKAQELGSDVVITWGGVQSNHCRQALSVAKYLGMDCYLLLTGDEPKVRQGNLLVYTIMGAEIYVLGSDESVQPEVVAQELADKLRKEDRKPFVVPVGASTPLGAVGYVESMQEAAMQAEEMGISFGHAFLPTGSAGTQAGAIVGAALYSPSTKVHGVSVSRSSDEQAKKVAEVVSETLAFLDISETVRLDDVIIHDEYYGTQYGVPTKEGNEAIRLVARTEGILLDPVYTGKAMAGMLDLLKKGVLDETQAVLFFHTGGYPAIFAYAEYFQE